jgi:hypothetical protein
VLTAKLGAGTVDTLEKDFGGGSAHFAQGLANRS